MLGPTAEEAAATSPAGAQAAGRAELGGGARSGDGVELDARRGRRRSRTAAGADVGGRGRRRCGGPRATLSRTERTGRALDLARGSSLCTVEDGIESPAAAFFAPKTICKEVASVQAGI